MSPSIPTYLPTLNSTFYVQSPNAVNVSTSTQECIQLHGMNIPGYDWIFISSLFTSLFLFFVKYMVPQDLKTCLSRKNVVKPEGDLGRRYDVNLLKHDKYRSMLIFADDKFGGNDQLVTTLFTTSALFGIYSAINYQLTEKTLVELSTWHRYQVFMLYITMGPVGSALISFMVPLSIFGGEASDLRNYLTKLKSGQENTAVAVPEVAQNVNADIEYLESINELATFYNQAALKSTGLLTVKMNILLLFQLLVIPGALTNSLPAVFVFCWVFTILGFILGIPGLIAIFVLRGGRLKGRENYDGSIEWVAFTRIFASLIVQFMLILSMQELFLWMFLYYEGYGYTSIPGYVVFTLRNSRCYFKHMFDSAQNIAMFVNLFNS